MKKSTKETVKNSLMTLAFLAVIGGLIFAAVKYAPKDPFSDNEFLQDVSERHRY